MQRTREEAEKACRDALATGDNGAWIVLGNVLVAQPGREEEAEDAYRKAIAAGDNSGWLGVGNVLLQRRGCQRDAEAAYRKAIAAGDNSGWLGVGNVLVDQPGREEEAEDAYRKAIAAGHNSGWLGVGNVLLQRRGCERDAEAAYRAAITDLDAETREGARRGAVLARRTRSTRRTKYALVALVVIAFVVNLIFKDDNSAAWTVLGNLDGVVFWLALCAFPVAVLVERAQVGDVLRDRRRRRRARRRTTRRASGPAIPGRRRVGSATAALRRLGERGRALREQLERRFPSLYDARYAGQGIARAVGPLVSPVLMGLVVAPILLLLAALAQALGLKAPAIDLPSIDPPSIDLPSIDAPDIPAPNITTPGWLRVIGDVLDLLGPYLFAAVVVILGIRRTVKLRRKRIQAEQLGRQELLRRLAVALCNIEATARARGADTAKVASVFQQRLEYQRAPAHVPRLRRRKRHEQA